MHFHLHCKADSGEINLIVSSIYGVKRKSQNLNKAFPLLFNLHSVIKILVQSSLRVK